MSAREEIAAAASSVAGLNVTPYYRQSMKSGDGCVSLQGGTVVSKFDRMATWRVYVALPQDVKAAEVWIDTHIQALLDALWPQIVITTWAPQELVTGDGATVNGLYIEGTRAQ